MKTVSIIDDDQSIRHSFSWIINDLGYRAESFSCMHDFLHAQAKKIQNNKVESLPYLILCDKHLENNKKIGGLYLQAMSHDKYLKEIPKIMITDDYIRPHCLDCDPNIKKCIDVCYNKFEVSSSRSLAEIIEKHVM